MIVAELSLAMKILEAVKALFGLRESLVKGDATRRASMAEKFEHVAACLEAAASEIRAGVFPAGRCAEMQTYASHLPPLVEEEIGKPQAQEIGRALEDASAVEQLYNGRTSPEGMADLRRLDEAAGVLHAMANIVRP
jgi:hypothetical protein